MFSGIETTVFACQCADTSHHVALTTTDGIEGSLFVCDHLALFSLRERIRASWRCLFGPEYVEAEVLLSPKVARDMARALNEWADKAPSQTLTVTPDTGVTWVTALPPTDGPTAIY